MIVIKDSGDKRFRFVRGQTSKRGGVRGGRGVAVAMTLATDDPSARGTEVHTYVCTCSLYIDVGTLASRVGRDVAGLNPDFLVAFDEEMTSLDFSRLEAES